MRTHPVARRILIVLLSVAAACTPQVGMPVTTTPATGGLRAVDPGPGPYEATVIVPDARWVDWIATSGTRLFLAINVRGARAVNTESRIAAMPLEGGDAATLAGTEALGAEITGIAVVSPDIVYFTRAAGTDLRDSGAFRYAGGRSVAVLDGRNAPTGIAVNRSGDLFVAETYTSEVLRIRGSSITTYAGRGGCAAPATPIEGPATASSLCGAGLLAMTASGDLYIAGRGPAWIVKVDATGTLTVLAADIKPSSLAIDGSGALLAASGSRLVRLDAVGRPAVIADGLGLISAISVGDDGSIYVLHSSASSATARVTRLRAI